MDDKIQRGNLHVRHTEIHVMQHVFIFNTDFLLKYFANYYATT
jgi:hypothetical protein